jgi:hypothetical protein
MLCPFCKRAINDELIRSEGARLMNFSRTKRKRDPKLMREIGGIGGRRPKTPAGRRKRKKEIEEYQAQVRRLSAELAEAQLKANPRTTRK